VTANQQDILCMLAYINLSQGRGADALDLLQLVNKFAPNNVEMLRALTYTYVLLNKGEEALVSSERLARIDRSPASEASILLLRSRALLSQKRLPEARAMFRAFVRLRAEQNK
jgi:tetratricopeptide (TPR) repeat protein